MKEEFDFNRIGKRMPYTCPEGFLDDIEKNVWKTIKKRRPIYAISGGILAASLTLLLVFNILSSHPKTDDFEKIERAFANLSNIDQDYLLTTYQNDLFINE